MLILKQGDIFKSEAEAILNPVNTVGIMGKGLAWQFKTRYPENYEKYVQKCKSEEFTVGSDLLYIKEKEKIIVNFPTKKHWREKSKIEYIQIGLKKLEELLIKENIRSVAIPPLGAGNGGLKWEDVKKEILIFEKNLKDKDIRVIIYEPSVNENFLGSEHFLLLKLLLRSYDASIDKDELSDSIFYDLIYLSDKKNYFKYTKVSEEISSDLVDKIYKELKDYTKKNKVKLKDLEKHLEKKVATKQIKAEDKRIEESIGLYQQLKFYFNLDKKNLKEIEKKFKLLVIVLCFIRKSREKEPDLDKLYKKIYKWNKDYTQEEFDTICRFLIKQNKLKAKILNNSQQQIF